MKVGDCQWLTTDGDNVVDTVISSTKPKWCNVESDDDVTFQVNHIPETGVFQIHSHFYRRTEFRIREDEYPAVFWLASIIELAAFLKDKRPIRTQQ